jgi:prepilin-type N-terminal cleavage/methylation domain-containing protein
MSALHRSRAGFTLVEVLAAIAIVALAVFPMLLSIEEAEKNVYDAKFASLCTGRMRSLLAELTRSAKPGQSGAGDFSTMTEEEGFDARFDFANLRYEWQCQSLDLSTDVAPVSGESDEEREERLEKSRQEKKEEQEELEEQDEAIDARFRVRYLRLTCTYKLEDGEERELVVETYVPPLPTQEQLKREHGREVVAPNNG